MHAGESYWTCTLATVVLTYMCMYVYVRMNSLHGLYQPWSQADFFFNRTKLQQATPSVQLETDWPGVEARLVYAVVLLTQYHQIYHMPNLMYCTLTSLTDIVRSILLRWLPAPSGPRLVFHWSVQSLQSIKQQLAETECRLFRESY